MPYYPNTGYTPNRYQMAQPPPQMVQQQFPQMMPQACGLKGRMVSSLDEVRAITVDMDGSETYFPHPASNSIYTKCIDMNGNAVIRHYVLEENAPPKVDPMKEELDTLSKKVEGFKDYSEDFKNLSDRVEELERMLNDLTGGGST